MIARNVLGRQECTIIARDAPLSLEIHHYRHRWSLVTRNGPLSPEMPQYRFSSPGDDVIEASGYGHNYSGPECS